MMTNDKKTRSVKAEQVIKTMQKRGVDISEKKAEEVLDLIYFLAELIVKQNFMHQDSNHLLDASADQQSEQG